MIILFKAFDVITPSFTKDKNIIIQNNRSVLNKKYSKYKKSFKSPIKITIVFLSEQFMFIICSTNFISFNKVQ